MLRLTLANSGHVTEMDRNANRTNVRLPPVQLELFRDESFARGLVCFVPYEKLSRIDIGRFLARNSVKSICDFRAKPVFDSGVNSHLDVSACIERTGITYRSVFLDVKKASVLISIEWPNVWKRSEKWRDINSAMEKGLCLVLFDEIPGLANAREIEKSYVGGCSSFVAEIPFRFLSDR